MGTDSQPKNERDGQMKRIKKLLGVKTSPPQRMVMLIVSETSSQFLVKKAVFKTTGRRSSVALFRSEDNVDEVARQMLEKFYAGESTTYHVVSPTEGSNEPIWYLVWFPTREEFDDASHPPMQHEACDRLVSFADKSLPDEDRHRYIKICDYAKSVLVCCDS